jgi:thymidylate synthase (FAD)
MKLIKPSYKILSKIDREEILKAIEVAGRTCYKSEDKITEDSSSKFVSMIVNKGHLAMIEHYSISVKFVCDRGVSHEIVRHRLCSFAQESTRYCNYSKDKFDNQLTFIIPEWIEEDVLLITNLRGYFCTDDYKEETVIWLKQMFDSEEYYNKLIQLGWQPQQARSVLPNSLKTEIVVTANLREWKEIFKQRCAPVAHTQMRELMIPLQEEFRNILPEIF